MGAVTHVTRDIGRTTLRSSCVALQTGRDAPAAVAERSGRDQPHPRNDLMRGDPIRQVQDEGGGLVGMG